jgi:hypothetical protein
MGQPTISTNPHMGNVHPALGVDRAAGELQYGAIYTGVIRVTNTNKSSFDVEVDHPKQTIRDAMWAGGIFSALLGVNTNYSPPPGSRVIVVYGKPAFIVSAAPSQSPDTSGGRSRTHTHEEVPQSEPSASDPYTNHRGPNQGADFLPGEFEIGNMIGVAIQFLTTLVKLQAGDRAKVECHLTDDMVRIVSGMFKHYSAFGDFEIIDQGGGPTVKWHGTSKTHEAWGRVNAGDEKAKVSKDRVGPTDVAETGRWRMTQLMGYLGDFIHLIVTDPEGTIGSFAQARAGKFDAHINNDGGFLMRSVSEISLEKVIRIPVPVEVRRYDSPDGNTREEIDNAVKSGGLNLDALLARWDYHPDRIHYLPYVLRHYSRYLSQLHSYARILSQDGDYSLGSEADAPAPSWNNGEEDVARANQGKPEFYEAYACIRILRDGSIVNIDAYGNSTLSSKRGMQYSSILDFEIEAARDIRMSCGRNFLLTARRHIELNAITGGIKARARIFWHMLCEWGSIWIKSDAPDPTDPEFDTKRAKDEDKLHPDDPSPSILEAAVYIDAERGSVLAQGGRKVMLDATGLHLADSEVSDTFSESGAVVLQSRRHDVHNFAGRNAFIYAQGLSAFGGNISFKSMRTTNVVSGTGVFVNTPGLFDINQQVTLREGMLHARGFVGNTLVGVKGIFGPKRGPRDGSVKSHYNHISYVDDAPVTEVELGTAEEVITGTFIRNSKFSEHIQFASGEPSWEYLPKDEYFPDVGDGAEAVPWLSLTQERLIEEASDKYETWNWTQNALNTKGSRSGRQYPHPWYGLSAQVRYAQNSEPLLSELSSTPPTALNDPPEIQRRAKSFRFKK